MSTKKPPMDLRQYWDAVGTDNMAKIIHEVDSTPGYFKMLRYGSKRPSGKMALKIIAAAEKHTAPYVPDLAMLIQGPPRAGHSPVKKKEAASEFIRARKRLLEKQAAA